MNKNENTILSIIYRITNMCIYNKDVTFSEIIGLLLENLGIVNIDEVFTLRDEEILYYLNALVEEDKTDNNPRNQLLNKNGELIYDFDEGIMTVFPLERKTTLIKANENSTDCELCGTKTLGYTDRWIYVNSDSQEVEIITETDKWNEYINDYDVESTLIRFCPECGRPASEIIKEWSGL